MEVCVDNVQSALNAQEGGAIRIELCSALSEGGLTPSAGLFRVVKRELNIPVFCMIRPRNGADFIYSEAEIEAMITDISTFKEYGADGFVFGCLTEEGKVDANVCKQLLESTDPMPATFHRAIDFVTHPFTDLETIIDLGFKRILTSGRAESVEYGTGLIKEMNEAASGRIIIMPGGGINEFNLAKVLIETKAVEFHGSAKKIVVGLHHNRYPSIGSQVSVQSSKMSVYGETDIQNVKRLIKIYKSIYPDDQS